MIAVIVKSGGVGKNICREKVNNEGSVLGGSFSDDLVITRGLHGHARHFILCNSSEGFTFQSHRALRLVIQLGNNYLCTCAA